MRTRMMLTAGVLTLSLAGGAALAGPCSSDIAQLDKTLSQSSGLGPATTGALSGAAPGAIKADQQANAQAPTAGTSAGSGQLGGTAGTKELNAASNQIATSPEDVRRQQSGQPTEAASAGSGSNDAETKPGSIAAATSGDKVSQAKMDVEQARALDAKGDQSCMAAVKRAQDAMRGS